MPSFSTPRNTAPPSSQPATSPTHAGSESPVAPPYSPITPILHSAALPAPTAVFLSNHTDPVAASSSFPPHRQPTPIDESTNPDTIALRAALAALQIQRVRAEKALRVLQKQKSVALKDPVGFGRKMGEGRIKGEGSGDPKGSTLRAIAAFEDTSTRKAMGNTRESEGALTSDDDDDDEEDEEDGGALNEEREGEITLENFGAIPSPQTVVRCPPINWAKYHVAGEALDKLHQEQQRNPDEGQPMGSIATQSAPAARGSMTAPVLSGGRERTRRQSHPVAAPYSPWKDELVAKPAAHQRPAR